jgi:hypothetical protein
MPGFPVRHSITLLVVAILCETVDLIGQTPSACKRVEGFQEETLAPPPTCTSSVGLCTVAQMFGTLKGLARFTAAEFLPSADTPATAVIFVIGDTEVAEARLGPKRGTLIVKNAAAYRTVGNGDLVDNQTIIGGTGDFVGASGSLRISGNFLAETGGISRFEGTVCVP